VNRVDVLQSFWWKVFGEILFADVIDTVASEFLPSLADQEPVLIRRLGMSPVLTDIELEKMRGFFLKRNEAESISLSQDGEGFFMWVEVVQVQRGDLRGPGS